MSADSQPDVNLFDVDTQQCPYDAYKLLRDEAPVYRCPATGMYVISRFEDVRRVLTDTEYFTNETCAYPQERFSYYFEVNTMLLLYLHVDMH